MLKRRLDASIVLTPLYAGAFNAPQLGTIIFLHDATGRATALTVSQDRVWDPRFDRTR